MTGKVKPKIPAGKDEVRIMPFTFKEFCQDRNESAIMLKTGKPWKP